MSKNLLVPVAACLLFLGSVQGQEKTEGQACPDLPGQTSATVRFRYEGEILEIPIRGDSPDVNGFTCEPVALDLHWTNGRNNGSNFGITFLDGNNRPIFTRGFSAFLSGVLQVPLSSFEPQPVYGSSMELISVPTTIAIQTARPFAAPASLSYTIIRVARPSKVRAKREEKTAAGEVIRTADSEQGNEVVSIRNTVRLIGGTRLPLVQVDLKTSRPFPVRDVPLQLQIGQKIFIDELSGDYTGRRLTLSLTPEMFAELKDGDQIVAFLSKPDGSGSNASDVWNFGKLTKSRRQ